MELGRLSSAAFAAYVAGFVDGEGNFYVNKGGGVRITIVNTADDLLHAIQRRLGYGSVTQRKLPSNKSHWKPIFCLVISNAKDCRTFLSTIYPYLQIKQTQAGAMREKINSWRNTVRSRERRDAAIRDAIASGQSQVKIAESFGISKQTVTAIKRGHTWASALAKRSSRVDAPARFGGKV